MCLVSAFCNQVILVGDQFSAISGSCLELLYFCIVLYYIVLYCIVLYCTVLYCICLGSTFRNQVNLVGDQLSAISGSCLELLYWYCIVLYCYCFVLYRIVSYRIVLYCVVLYCIVSVRGQLFATRLIWLGSAFCNFRGLSGTWRPRRCNDVVAAVAALLQRKRYRVAAATAAIFSGVQNNNNNNNNYVGTGGGGAGKGKSSMRDNCVGGGS